MSVVSSAAGSDRLTKQIQFILEMDRLKNVLRRNPILRGARRENNAEHSWHLCLMALCLADKTSEALERFKLLKMVLVHNLVEIDIGEVFVFEPYALPDREELERKSSDRIFNLLPADQASEFKALWKEYVLGETVEARFLRALDRLHTVLNNALNDGGDWKEFRMPYSDVMGLAIEIEKTSPELGTFARKLIEHTNSQGGLAQDRVE